MITKITAGNNQAYQALFNKATEAYNANKSPGEPELIFTNLAQYFSKLGTLSKIDPSFTFLPLDEPFFEINANTRLISIPAEFKKNGIAVIGENAAEILFFKIDRYFDATDLNEMQICVQWKNSKGISGLSYISDEFKSITLQPGYVVFGWPIFKEMTNQANGPLEFTVRFYKIEEKELVYNFNTLTAKAVINSTLDFDIINTEGLEILDKTKNTDLLNRIKDTTYIDVSTEQPAIPELISINPKTGILEVDLDDNDEFEIQMYAFDPEGTGFITYDWTKDNKSLPYELEYIPVEYNSQTNYLYYYKNEEGRFVVWDEELELPEDTQLYLYGSTYVATTAGDYNIKAKNQSSEGWNATYSNTLTVSIPAPVVEAINIREDNYSIILPEEEGGKVTIGPNSESDISFVYGGTSNESNVTKTYQWYKGDDLIEHDTDDTTENYQYTINYTGNKENDTGYYYLGVIAERNNLTKEFTAATPYRVTYPAKVEVIDSPTRYDLSSSSPLQIILNNTDFDTITIKWIREYDSEVLLEQTLTKEEFDGHGSIIISCEDNSIFELGEDYYAQVINDYNGNTATDTSNTWVIGK